MKIYRGVLSNTWRRIFLLSVAVILFELCPSTSLNAQTLPVVRQVENHKLASGETYSGEIVNGQPHGRGLLINHAGMKIFNHGWVNGQPTSTGGIELQNGIRIIGRMRTDFSFNSATMTFKDDAEITGTRWKIIPGFDWVYAAVEDTAIVRLPDGKWVKVRFNMATKQYDVAE